MKVLGQAQGKIWNSYHADTIEFTSGMPDNCIDFSIYSPPYAQLYIYSESERDLGNVDSQKTFFECYSQLLKDLFRVTKPGRLTAIHVKETVYYSNSSERGSRGLSGFVPRCIIAHQEAGWDYHRNITIRRCPVKEMQKTKADRLLYRNFRLDAARTGGGLCETLAVFRKWSDGMDDTPPVLHDPKQYPVEYWQDLASDVWEGLPETDVLNAKVARNDDAERHLCPMPINITKRGVIQWTNPGDVVYSPFMGIGSEGYAALQLGRRFIGTELNEAYWKQANKFLAEAEANGVEASGFDFSFEAAE